MSLVLLALGALLLAVPAIITRSQLTPAQQIRTAALAITAGSAVSLAAVTVSVVPLIVWWHDGRDWAAIGELAHLAPAGPTTWFGAALAATVAGIAAVRLTRRCRRARQRAALPSWATGAKAGSVAGVDVMVIPTDDVVAVALPPRQVVVSSHVLENLTREEFDAVVRHEIAHLVLRHHRYLFLIQTYDRLYGWLPGMTATAEQLRLAVEKWADIEAVGTLGANPNALNSAAQKLGRSYVVSDQHTSAPTQVIRGQLAGINLVLTTTLCAATYAVLHSIGDISDVFAITHQ